jgi:uncharacterized protein (TIGR02996 family)
MKKARSPAASLAVVEPLVVHEPGRALEGLLDLYRATWHPGVATLIDRLGVLHASRVDGLPVTQTQRAEALVAALSKSTALGRTGLLSAVGDFAASAQGTRVWPTIEACGELTLDPRVAGLALRLLTTRGAIRELTAKLLRRLVRCIERHGHQGLLTDFDLWRAGPALTDGVDARRLANVAATLRARVPGPVDEDALARLLTQVPAPLAPSLPVASSSVPAEGLLDAVLAAPDDDAPRLMYADLLTEQADPRGEFIALQCARAQGRVSAEARRREAELLHQHRVAFLWRFANRVTLSGLRFDRGFLVRATLRQPLPREPLCRLLEDVEFGRHSSFDGALDRLHTARHLALEVLGEVMARAPRLEHATTQLWTRGPEWTLTRELLARLPRPLTSLALELPREGEPLAFVLREAFSLPPLRGLEALELSFPRGLPTPQTLALAPATLRTVTLHLRAPFVSLTLERQGATWARARLDTGYAFDGVGAHLDGLMDLGVTTLSITANRYSPGVLQAVNAELAARPALTATVTLR